LIQTFGLSNILTVIGPSWKGSFKIKQLSFRKENIMKSLRTKILIICSIAFFSFGFIGCNNEGPAEKAGKNIDQAFDSAKEKVEEATE
jgi:hypothetical protein